MHDFCFFNGKEWINAETHTNTCLFSHDCAHKYSTCICRHINCMINYRQWMAADVTSLAVFDEGCADSIYPKQSLHAPLQSFVLYGTLIPFLLPPSRLFSGLPLFISQKDTMTLLLPASLSLFSPPLTADQTENADAVRGQTETRSASSGIHLNCFRSLM